MNNSSNYTEISHFQWITVDMRIVFGLIYVLVILIGVSGNTLVILAVTKVPSMKTVTNVFIANLAVADLIVTTICCPLILSHMITYPNWTLGENMCYFTTVCIHLSLSGSSFGLLAISVDRYFAIAHVQRHLMTFKRVNIVIVVTWLLSVMLAVPSALIRPETTRVIPSGDLCLLVWRGSEATKRFEMFKGFVFLVIFHLIAFFYYRIARVLWKRKIPGNQTSENQEAASKARKKVVKLLLIVLACFLFCWAPMILNRVVEMVLPDGRFDPPVALYTGTTVLAMANSAMNPVLYSLFNRNFRTAFRNIYRKCFNNQVVPLPEAFSVATPDATSSFRPRPLRRTLASLMPGSKNK